MDSKPTKERRSWSNDRGDGAYDWHGRVRMGRLELGYHVYKHTYYHSSDRWVFQPFWVWDRR